MKYIVADTCIVLHILRNNAIGQAAVKWLRDVEYEYTLVISVVTKAELHALKIQLGWGANRTAILDAFLQKVTYIDINHTDETLLQQYAMIDGYSKGKHPDSKGKMKGGTAHTMGKNDLWIAATASVIDAVLLTGDGGFDHLNETFLKIEKFN